MTTATRFVTVPAGSSPSLCRGPNCGATIYWVRNGYGATPVDCDVEGGRRPSETKDTDQGDFLSPHGVADVHDGQGVNHFTNCVDAELFHKRR